MSFANQMALLGAAAAPFYRLWDVANNDATTLQTLQTNLISAANTAGGTRAIEVQNGWLATKRRLASLLAPETIRTGMEPALLAVVADADIAGTATNANDAMREIREYMDDNAQTVNARGFTYGAFTTTATGTGAIYRITVDKNGDSLESLWPEAKKIVCTRDSGQAASHNETFQYRGTGTEPDHLFNTGSGSRINFESISALGGGTDRPNMCANPSFEQATGTSFSGTTSALTGLTNWTLSAGVVGDLTLDRTASTGYYRGYEGLTTPTGLRIGGAVTLTQVPRTTTGEPWKIGIPYRRQIAVYRPTGVTGTITFSVGSQSIAQSIASLTAGAWNVVALPDNENAFYDNFRQADTAVSITTASISGGVGYVTVDDVIVAPYVALNGIWYAVVGGVTRWARSDEFTWTDSITTPANEGVLQRVLWMARLGSLPSDNSGSETVPDPTV